MGARTHAVGGGRVAPLWRPLLGPRHFSAAGGRGQRESVGRDRSHRDGWLLPKRSFVDSRGGPHLVQSGNDRDTETCRPSAQRGAQTNVRTSLAKLHPAASCEMIEQSLDNY